ncbi:hypothetical protein GCM10022239_05920 [Leifsonia bigeumensis]|uniref:Uncharacterized protein n=1 Tax=Leifsonella bigeumensis TaxID=433643 RepID=A0ABP7F6C1_9MICO
MSALTVRAEPGSISPGRIPETLATLPESLRLTDDHADIIAVLGDAGWSHRALSGIRSGARGVMVVNPCIEEVRELRTEANAASVPVVLDTSWVHNPAVAAVSEQLRRIANTGALVESTVTLDAEMTDETAILAQLVLIRATVGAVRRVDFWESDEHGYRAFGHLESATDIAVSAIRTNAYPPSARLRVVGRDELAELSVPAPSTATSALAVSANTEEQAVHPTPFESAHRSAWRRLHSVTTTGVPVADLSSFAEDAVTARRILSRSGSSETS